MFGFGISEIVTLLIVAVVLINPRELPTILRKAGKLYGVALRQVNGVRKSFGAFEDEVKSMTDFREFKETEKK